MVVSKEIQLTNNGEFALKFLIGTLGIGDAQLTKIRELMNSCPKEITFVDILGVRPAFKNKLNVDFYITNIMEHNLVKGLENAKENMTNKYPSKEKEIEKLISILKSSIEICGTYADGGVRYTSYIDDIKVLFDSEYPDTFTETMYTNVLDFINTKLN